MCIDEKDPVALFRRRATDTHSARKGLWLSLCSRATAGYLLGKTAFNLIDP